MNFHMNLSVEKMKKMGLELDWILIIEVGYCVKFKSIFSIW